MTFEGMTKVAPKNTGIIWSRNSQANLSKDGG